MTRTPWHIWVVGILATLWNAGGAWNYFAMKVNLESVVSQMTPDQLAFFSSMPTWATATWAIAVWGALVGSILILFKSRASYPVLAISFAAMVLTTIQNFVLADVSMADIMPPGAAIFPGIIFVVGALLVWYAKVQRDRGNFR